MAWDGRAGAEREPMRAAGIGDNPVVVGGIIPPEDEAVPQVGDGVAVGTPKNFDLEEILRVILWVWRGLG